MKIHSLNIEGFKSIGKINLVEPNPFSVFVGPNGAGKSNIFEALEFMQLCNNTIPEQVIEFYGKLVEVINQIGRKGSLKFSADLARIKPGLLVGFYNNNDSKDEGEFIPINSSYRHFGSMFKIKNPVQLKALSVEQMEANSVYDTPEFLQFTNFSRVFVGERESRVKRRNNDDIRLISNASNLEKVLKRILKNEKDRDEIIEILQLLVPGFEYLEIRTEELSGSDHLLIYESSLKKPINKHIISDGTYNILALIAAIYQSKEPQFLCIEEPENGLNPKVVRELVKLFRSKCEERGHYIWLNTHSQTLVAELTADEIILVDKVDGNTVTKQIKGMNLHGLRMDEALLTNALGGGIPW